MWFHLAPIWCSCPLTILRSARQYVSGKLIAFTYFYRFHSFVLGSEGSQYHERPYIRLSSCVVCPHRSLPEYQQAYLLTYAMYYQPTCLSVCRPLTVLCLKLSNLLLCSTSVVSSHRNRPYVAGSGCRDRKAPVYASQSEPAATWSGWFRGGHQEPAGEPGTVAFSCAVSPPTGAAHTATGAATATQVQLGGHRTFLIVFQLAHPRHQARAVGQSHRGEFLIPLLDKTHLRR